jgi:hypothetical protein
VQLLNSPELSDFTIVAANGQEIFVHQVILLTRWPHFKNIHKSGMSEAFERKMTIPEPVEVIMAFLKFLYSDRLDESEPWQVICDLLVMANMYLLHRLKKLCCERLYRYHMTLDSCGLIFEKAIMAEEIGLKLLVLSFMFQNYGFLLKSNMIMDLPSPIRQEFLDAVPEEAVLEVGRSRYVRPPLTQQQHTIYTTNSHSQNSFIYMNNNSSQPNSTTSLGNATNSSSNYHHHHHHHHHIRPQQQHYITNSSSNSSDSLLTNQRSTQATTATATTTNELIPINTTNNNTNDMTVEV